MELPDNKKQPYSVSYQFHLHQQRYEKDRATFEKAMLENRISLYRSFEDWQWFHKPEMVQLFLCLLLNASSSQKQWRSLVIERGQLTVSYDILKAKTGLSVRTLRTCLDKLENSGEITKKITNKCTIITICNYDNYYCNSSENNPAQQSAPELVLKPEIAKPISKPSKKTKDEVIAETNRRMKAFYNSLVPFLKTYPKEMIRAFYDYWSETNKSGSKVKFEQETTWVLEKRLQRWSQNDRNYKSKCNENVNNRTTTAEDRANGAAAIIASLAEEEQRDSAIIRRT